MLNDSTRAVRLRCHMKIVFETKTAVNRFASRPATSVTAKPRIGPVPKTNKKIADTIERDDTLRRQIIAIRERMYSLAGVPA